MALPPGNDRFVASVLAANPNTAVVLQSGTPVEMPWIDQADALLQVWYGGNEGGNGIADVLFGDVNPVRTYSRRQRILILIVLIERQTKP